MVLALGAADARGQGGDGPVRKPVVLVPPFENQSKKHESISIEVATGNNPNQPKRRYSVDRYTEVPRTLFEDMLANLDGVAIVERQRVDTLLVESEFGRLSGLVDPAKAQQLGNMLGANLIVMGTIVDLHDEVVTFNGYGIRTENTTIHCQIRFRMLEAGSGNMVYSKVFKGSKTYPKSNFGGKESKDRFFEAIEVVLQKVADDADFRAAVRGKKAGAGTESGGVEVEFAPKPENCDIEIDGKYVGGSPIKRKLQAGKEYKIRISKEGYKDWQGVIVPEAGLRITRELGASR
jgi:hypothetical protein